MKCMEVHELLEAYIDGDLSAGLCRAIEDHLAVCSVCREEMKQAVRIAFQLRSLPEKECPSGVSNRVRTFLQNPESRWLANPFAIFRRHPLPAWSLSIAAVFLSCSVVFIHDTWQRSAVEKPAYSLKDAERARQGITLAFHYINYAGSRTRTVLLEENVPGKVLQPLKRSFDFRGLKTEKGRKS